jgi:hypothetical protein
MPTEADSNSPAFWRGGRFHLFNSTGVPILSVGIDQFQMADGTNQKVAVNRQDHFAMWIESVWQDPDGTLYAWYHNEPAGLCPGNNLTAPRIGALVSYDGGQSFVDFGIVLSSGDPIDCSAKNGFFGGGHGDFSVILDQEQRYFYFLFGNYGGPLDRQGVSIARMAYEDRVNPSGMVWKFSDGAWDQPGIGGRVTPIFPATVAWQRTNADSFWGPSIHWNTALQKYVVLLNRACCAPEWPQEGIYASFNPDLANPGGWKKPVRILHGSEIGFAPGYYPQVLGMVGEQTDSMVGAFARLYIKGISNWEIFFFPE